jgi:hypothetical protein
VVTSESLTKLYGFAIEVLRMGDRVFVISSEGNVTEGECAHHHHDHE